MSNRNISEDMPFGKKHGIWYPLAHKILSTHKYWSPSMWLPKDSAVAIDVYIGSWWLLELFIILLYCNVFHWQGIGAWVLVALIIFRLLDLMFVLFSILIKGSYNKEKEWVSVNRITLLVILNALELMVLYGILFRAFSVLTPNIAAISPELDSFFSALYFSFVTGTSLGYGVPIPTGWLSRLLAIVEVSSIILVVIAVVGYIAGEKRRFKS